MSFQLWNICVLFMFCFCIFFLPHIRKSLYEYNLSFSRIAQTIISLTFMKLDGAVVRGQRKDPLNFGGSF